MSSGTLSPTVALVVKLVAKPDETDEISTFLADAVSLANQEQGTIAWFALRTDTTTFWIVDAFPSDRERQAHLEGPIAASLLANAERLLDGPPENPPGRGPRRQVAPMSACAPCIHARRMRRGPEPTAAPGPTQPHRRPSSDSPLAETVSGYYRSELIYGACPIGAVEDQNRHTPSGRNWSRYHHG
jgi:quinol monooxygenase YgiN